MPERLRSALPPPLAITPSERTRAPRPPQEEGLRSPGHGDSSNYYDFSNTYVSPPVDYQPSYQYNGG